MGSRGRIVLALIVVLIVGLPLIVLLAVMGPSTEAVAGLVGVLVGGTITGLSQYLISELDRKQQLRLAALEKRLRAHQEAYTLWRHLLFADGRGEDIYDVALQCQEWWEANCLYLSAEARRAFCVAYLSAVDYAVLLRTHQSHELLRDARKDIRRAGEVIVKSVLLPSLGEAEARDARSRGGDDGP